MVVKIDLGTFQRSELVRLKAETLFHKIKKILLEYKAPLKSYHSLKFASLVGFVTKKERRIEFWNISSKTYLVPQSFQIKFGPDCALTYPKNQ